MRFWHQKISWAILWRFCVILRLALSLEHRLVTDRQTDGQTDTGRQLTPALASVARVKICAVF